MSIAVTDPPAAPRNGPPGFAWLIPGQLAGTPRPDGAADLAMLAQLDTRLLVTLTAESPPDTGLIARHGIASLYTPIPDFMPPTLQQARDTCVHVAQFLERGAAVVYHCRAGKGRTGTLLAAQLVWNGQTAAQAITFTRARNPEWIETQGQLDFLHEFAATVR